MQVDILHYLNTFIKKPGAIRNSLALKSVPILKNIFDRYYSKQPRKFINILMENKDISIAEIKELFKMQIANKGELASIDVIKSSCTLDMATRHQLARYGSLCVGGGRV